MTAGPDPAAITPDAEAGVLTLNNEHAAELSWLDAARLRALIGRAFYARVIGRAEAFLLAFDERADYDSPNFLWFRTRSERFVYVDRLAVASSARGRGLARLLYADLTRHAVDAGHRVLACEVNRVPANPASDALHTALGFAEIGEAAIHGGQKTVRYLVRSL